MNSKKKPVPFLSVSMFRIRLFWIYYAGAAEPSGLLPLQMPLDMKTVETQKEDVPYDMICHKDSEGNIYDFGFGMNWNGVIKDARAEKYRKTIK